MLHELTHYPTSSSYSRLEDSPPFCRTILRTGNDNEWYTKLAPRTILSWQQQEMARHFSWKMGRTLSRMHSYHWLPWWLDLSDVSPTWRLPRCFNLALRILQRPSTFLSSGCTCGYYGETIAVRIVSGPENLLIIPTWNSQMWGFKTVLPSMDGCQNCL